MEYTEIKNIVFDLGNVLSKGHSSYILDNMDLSKEEKDYIKEKFFAYNLDLDLGKISLEDYYKKRNIVLAEDIKDRVLHYYVDREFDEGLIEIIKELKKKDYKFYILSNNNKEVREYIINLPLYKDYFDGEVFSCEYNVVKPNEQIYQILLEKYNLKAEETVFIDDKKENIEASIKLGFKGFVYETNPNVLKEFLRKNNVNI